VAGERNYSPPEAERRRLRAELATARAGVSRNLAVVEARLRNPLRRLARWRWSAPLLLIAGAGVLVASVGRGRRSSMGLEQEGRWIRSLLRTTLAPILMRAAARYVESRLLAPSLRGQPHQGGIPLRQRARP